MKKKLDEIIRKKSMEFTFENGEITCITYNGTDSLFDNGWKAYNLLDVNTISNSGWDTNKTEKQFQKEVLRAIAPIEPIISEIARSFDCTTYIMVHFGIDDYEISVSDDDCDTVMIDNYDEITVVEPESILRHYNPETAFYNVVKQINKVCNVNLKTKTVTYNTIDDNDEYEEHTLSFDGEGNILD